MNRGKNLPVLIAAIVIAGILAIWWFTIEEKNEILGRGTNGHNDNEVVYSGNSSE